MYSLALQSLQMAALNNLAYQQTKAVIVLEADLPLPSSEIVVHHQCR